MKLADWRRSQHKTQQQLADDIGVILTTIARYESGARTPGPAIAIEIYRVTGGAVTPNDFYNLPSPSSAPRPDGEFILSACKAVEGRETQTFERKAA